jgi:5-methyltetrahydrofolate--homocysteine methyltransferase
VSEILKRIALCVERGKVDTQSFHPPEMEGQDGTDELTRKALETGISPNDILTKGLIAGMQRAGEKFRDNTIYLPDVLMSAKSMSISMKHLSPFFNSGVIKHKGKIVMGTVAGDLHDIGKKIVAMFFEGGGWKIIDLGVDVSAEKFIHAIKEHRPFAVGLSALLTTTMISMESIAKEIKTEIPDAKVIIGGAPVTQDFADRIGADAYSSGPQDALDYLNAISK